MKDAKFQIYNASAGSGKTFTLVREYLCILLGSENKDLFKQVLAITFTNKAVNEMKERILESLAEFADPEILDTPSPLFEAVNQTLKLPSAALQQRAHTLIHYLLHNYAFFDIVTIDKFTHRLIRTFARDLNLPQNFEVAMDTESLLKEAIDELLYKAGEDKILTETLIRFALERADDDKHWDLSRDLLNISRLLLKENDKPYLETLKHKSLKDFLVILNDLQKEFQNLKQQLQGLAQDTLLQIREAGIASTDFKGGSKAPVPGFFTKTSAGDMDYDFNKSWVEKLDSDPLYAASFKGNKAALDSLQPLICERVHLMREGMQRYQFLRAIYTNLAPMSLINAVNKELDKIRKEQQLLPISDFNDLISEAISDQPAPFIYERLGERYRNYFIDEFQDTSAMQWNNLKPLVVNALSGETLSGKKGSLMIVGDAKQSIYRWRGGKAEQFIDLYGNEKHNPFPVEKQVINLPRNYRSFDEIIRFNNQFFHFLSRFLSNTSYRELFERHSGQEVNNKSGGFVQFYFVDKQAEDKTEEQLLQCVNTIDQLTAEGYSLGDIAILNRGNKDALKVAQHLTEKGIPVISSESLLLQNDPKVVFLVNLVRYAYREEDRENLLEMLWFLAEERGEKDIHEFLARGLTQPNEVMTAYDFSLDLFRQLPFYNALEYALEKFRLYSGDEAYIQAFLDTVLDFTQKESGSMSDFVEYWESRKHKLSLAAPEHANAVQILTIHKSKGLEFPVVIYPFANTDVYHEVDPKLWIPLPGNSWGLPYALVNKNKKMENFGEEAARILTTYTEQQELDTFNVLYVTFTRAVERLYVICEEKTKARGDENLNTLPGIFINYLKETGHWQPGQNTYSFGTPEKKYMAKLNKGAQQQGIPFTTNKGLLNNYTIITRSGSLWGTGAEASIEKGTLYHELLSRIRYREDLEPVLDDALSKGILSAQTLEESRNYLNNLLTHDQLGPFFTSEYEIIAEKELITASGELLRPDRIMIKGQQAWIIDYKTGEASPRYHLQLDKYARALQEMGFKVTQKLLVFIGEEIGIETLS